MSVDEITQNIAAEFWKYPRNKVFVSEDVLVASAIEETGLQISKEELREIISNYEAGEIEEQSKRIFDGAVYVCGEVARLCFGEDRNDENEEVDYEISWVIDFDDEEDDAIAAEIRPC